MQYGKAIYIHLLIILAAVAVCFCNTLGHGFVWDDTVLLVGQEVYRQFDLAGMFMRPGNGLEYLPLRDLSYAIDYAMWGERPFGFHLTNLFLYMVNAVAVYVLARKLMLRLGKPETTAGNAAFLCALIFSIHPLHSEAVSFITCRNVLLSGMFFFLSLLFYLVSDNGGRINPATFAASLLCFVAALLSKATVIILPLLLLLPPFTEFKSHPLRRILRVVPFFVISSVFFVSYRTIGKESGIIDAAHQGFTSSALLDRLSTALQIPPFYLGKFLLPVGLSANYDIDFDLSWRAPAVWLSAAGLGLLIALVVYRRRESVIPAFAVGWYLITLVPVLNLFATVPVVADRYAYLPVFAPCFIAGAAIAHLCSTPWRGAAYVTTLLAVGTWGSMTFGRNGVWRSERTLWEATMKSSPGHIKNRVNLAAVYFHEQQYEKALGLLEVTKGKNHYYDYYHLFKGYIAVKQDNLPAAVAAFRQALEKNDSFLPPLYEIAETHEKLKEYDKAVEYYNLVLLSTELDTNRHKESSRKALQRLLISMNPEIDEWRQRVRENPGDLIGRMLLAEKLGEFGQYEEALVNFLEMERLGLGSWKLYTSIAKTYLKLRDYSNSAAYFEKGLSLNHDHPESLNTLAIVYKKLNRYDRAIPLFQQAVALGDPLGHAAFNLALTYYQQGDREASIGSFMEVKRRYPNLEPKAEAYLSELAEVRNVQQ